MEGKVDALRLDSIRLDTRGAVQCWMQAHMCRFSSDRQMQWYCVIHANWIVCLVITCEAKRTVEPWNWACMYVCSRMYVCVYVCMYVCWTEIAVLCCVD